MRQDPSKAENMLWQYLRNRQVNGWKFRRQHVLGNYIADFLCHDCHLVIELDGDSHDGRVSIGYSTFLANYLRQIRGTFIGSGIS
jgi:very-short-patch-repair endonuclease